MRHAPRERVSWNILENNPYDVTARHAPRERVSWNPLPILHRKHDTVTLHVSVWVEITTRMLLNEKKKRHAPRERVSWNFY